MSVKDFIQPEVVPVFHPSRHFEGLEEAVLFEPGHVDPGPPGPNWTGKSGMRVRFVLRGPKGATQFLLDTGWVPGLDEEVLSVYPLGVDLGYHPRTPQYDGATPSMESCMFLGEDEPCYYDGSGLAAYEFVKEFTINGEDAVWRRLYRMYRDMTRSPPSHWSSSSRRSSSPPQA